MTTEQDHKTAIHEREKLVDAAINFAIERHGSQKYGEWPYGYHLGMVHANLRELHQYQEPTINEEIVAYLHDVVEDTDTTIEEVVERFGQEVGDAVAAITKTNNREHYLDTVSSNPIATKIKMCDMMANMQQCLIDGDNKRANYYCKKLSELLSKTY